MIPKLEQTRWASQEAATAINKGPKKNTTPRLVLFSIHDLLHQL